MLSGILALDKPRGLTSHDVVDRIRRIAGQRQVGHAGTLDPIATGVLTLCLGQATRLSEQLMSAEKWYLARVVFGVSTETNDLDGTQISLDDSPIDLTQLARALSGLIGSYDQLPPVYAAIKQDGVPAYQRAREGKTVEMERRPVTVRALALLKTGHQEFSFRTADPARTLEAPYCDLLVCCSKGTYIRALARDIGSSMQSSACMASLRRLASGTLTTEDCVSLTALEQGSPEEKRQLLAMRLLPMEFAVRSWPAVVLDHPAVQVVSHGGPVPISSSGFHASVRLYDHSGDLIALGRAGDPEHQATVAADQIRVWPNRVFDRAEPE